MIENAAAALGGGFSERASTYFVRGLGRDDKLERFVVPVAPEEARVRIVEKVQEMERALIMEINGRRATLMDQLGDAKKEAEVKRQLLERFDDAAAKGTKKGKDPVVWNNRPKGDYRRDAEKALGVVQSIEAMIESLYDQEPTEEWRESAAERLKNENYAAGMTWLVEHDAKVSEGLEDGESATAGSDLPRDFLGHTLGYYAGCAYGIDMQGEWDTLGRLYAAVYSRMVANGRVSADIQQIRACSRAVAARWGLLGTADEVASTIGAVDACWLPYAPSLDNIVAGSYYEKVSMNTWRLRSYAEALVFQRGGAQLRDTLTLQTEPDRSLRWSRRWLCRLPRAQHRST